jgi:hypothetical protein
MKKKFTVFIKEIIPIIVGVLIAMYINNWNEERKDKKYINHISLSIIKELKEANNEIKDKIPIQKSLIDTLDIYINNNEISLFNTITKTNGLNFPSIKMNSWKAISNSRIELLDYDKISDMANIEEQKDILEMKIDKLTDLIYPNIFETGKDKKLIMKIMMLDIIQSEQSLQKGIEQIIETSK